MSFIRVPSESQEEFAALTAELERVQSEMIRLTRLQDEGAMSLQEWSERMKPLPEKANELYGQILAFQTQT